jgi:phosphoglycolate phosphatase
MLDGSREAKEEIVEEALYQLSGSNPDIVNQSKKQIAMIGDRKYDVEGAKKHNVTAVGVRFGFAEAGELEEAGADFIAETVDDLEAYLIA